MTIKNHGHALPVLQAIPFCIPISLILIAIAPVRATADHGPGTSGGGASTQSGETLKPGKGAFDLRFDFTEFQRVSRSESEQKAQKSGNFDFLDRSLLTTVSVAYGAAEDLQFGASWGYYDASGAGESEKDPTTGVVDTSTFDPSGVTDLWLTFKYRFARNPSGHWAVFGGEKFPIGQHDVKNSSGESVEPSATAGSGSFDTMAGVAYSVWLDERTTLDASAQYTLRTEHERFKLGDRIDVATAVAYRLTEDIKKYPQAAVFGEVLYRHLFKSTDHGDADPNTGGDAVFVSPGLRWGPSERVTFTIAPQFPIYQDLNGEQLKTNFKFVFGISISF